MITWQSLKNAYAFLSNGKKCMVTASGGDSIYPTVNKFGFNPDVDTGSRSHVWTPGGLYPLSTFITPQSLEVVGTDANDTAAGTGAQQVTVEGLDENLLMKTATVSMNGLSAVALPGLWLAVNRMYVEVNGSGRRNANAILCRLSGGGVTVSEIDYRGIIGAPDIGKGQTEQAIYRVPTGMVGKIKYCFAFLEDSGGTNIEVNLVRVSPDCVTERVIENLFAFEQKDAERVYTRGGPEVPGGGWAVMEVVTSSNNTQVAAGFDMEII